MAAEGKAGGAAKAKPRGGRGGGRSRPGCKALILLALLLLVAAAAVGAWAWRAFFAPYRGYPGEGVTVDVPAGSGGAGILNRMEAAGVLADARLARLYLIHALGDPPLKAGSYEFSGAASGPQVLAKLIRGEVITESVTLIEGLTLEETADALMAATGFEWQRPALLSAMRDPAPISDLDPAAGDLEGYLFPDTYSFALGTGEEEVVAELVATFRRRYDEQVRAAMAGGPLSLRELVTLASIVEKEAQLDEERPMIAAVYHNRLDRGMGLYADPTVIFALKKLGRWDGNLRRGDLKLDSPYNTYRYGGLPPGPIASPGLASLLAAAQPADLPYLYFVSRNDGSHVFAETLAEHNRNVEKWQREYWRRRWAEERKQRDGG